MARSFSPLKAEYIGADQTVIVRFRLQTRGGPYIPISRHNAPVGLLYICRLLTSNTERPNLAAKVADFRQAGYTRLCQHRLMNRNIWWQPLWMP
jgi:hypothetical protein